MGNREFVLALAIVGVVGLGVARGKDENAGTLVDRVEVLEDRVDRLEARSAGHVPSQDSPSPPTTTFAGLRIPLGAELPPGSTGRAKALFVEWAQAYARAQEASGSLEAALAFYRGVKSADATAPYAERTIAERRGALAIRIAACVEAQRVYEAAINPPK